MTHNKWVDHIKEYQRQHNCSYKEAMKGAKDTYQKGGSLIDVIDKIIYNKLGYSPKMKDMLKKHGNDTIKLIQIWRTPVQSVPVFTRWL